MVKLNTHAFRRFAHLHRWYTLIALQYIVQQEFRKIRKANTKLNRTFSKMQLNPLFLQHKTKLHILNKASFLSCYSQTYNRKTKCGHFIMVGLHPENAPLNILYSSLLCSASAEPEGQQTGASFKSKIKKELLVGRVSLDCTEP